MTCAKCGSHRMTVRGGWSLQSACYTSSCASCGAFAVITEAEYFDELRRRAGVS